MIKAKPVVPDQYWILTDGSAKVGNIQADDSGFRVTVKNSTMRVEDLADLADTVPVQFEAQIR